MIIDTSSNCSASIALLQAKGVSAVGRYYSSSEWKRLTPGEARLLSKNGFDIFTVFENSGDPILSVDKGVFDGQLALQQAQAAAQPEGSAIYFALEHLPSGYDSSHVAGTKLYIEGVRKVLAKTYKIGVYSNGVILEAILDNGLCDFAWLSASRAFAGSKAFYQSKRWALAQDPKVDQQWGPLSVDLNEFQGSFGAFRVPVPVFAPEQRDRAKALVETRFSGEPQTVWLTRSGPDREMQLLEDFWFEDRGGKRWTALKDSVVDGASIPKALWSTVGSPFTGDYRRASIVHDIACVIAKGDWQKRREADRMFYEACVEGSCTVLEATILYIGVRIGALANHVPAWRRAVEEDDRPVASHSAAARRLRADLELAAELVTSEPEVDDPEIIEARTDRALSVVSALDLAGL